MSSTGSRRRGWTWPAQNFPPAITPGHPRGQEAEAERGGGGKKGEKKPVAILQDLQGPKVRLDRFEGGGVELKTGATFTLTSRAILGTAAHATLREPPRPA